MAKYYVGMDLASDGAEFCVLGQRGAKKASGKMSWAPGRWKSLVKEYGAENLVVAFEAAPEAYRAQRLLEKWKVETYPFHAADFQTVAKSKRKTDRIDAERIARALRSDDLPRRVQLANQAEAALRNRVSEREFHRKVLQQAHNRIRGLARQHGVTLPRFSKDRAEEWWTQAPKRFAKNDQRSIERVAQTALAAYQALDELQEEVNAMMQEAGLSESANRLRTIPGFGPVISSAVAIYLGKDERFTNGRRFGAYLGLVPTVDSTGKQTTKLGHITKDGPSAIRRLLVQAAHSAVRSHAFIRSPLFYWFEKLRKKKGRKIAIVALARKLAIVAYAINRDQSEWIANNQR